VLAVHSSLDVPLAHVRGASQDPDALREPHGIRLMGTSLPGVAAAGSFCDGVWLFMVRAINAAVRPAVRGLPRLTRGRPVPQVYSCSTLDETSDDTSTVGGAPRTCSVEPPVQSPRTLAPTLT
jgi:hypothetical protein